MALMVKNIKIDLFTNYDKIQFKFTEYEISDRYEAYLFRYRRLIYLECIAKWCLISQYVTTTLSKVVKQDDRSLV